MQYQNREGDDQSSPTAPPGSGSSNTSNGPEGANSALAGSVAAPADEDLEEKALGLAIEEMFEESGGRWRPWAANGRATRMGEIVLIVDSDTVVPEVCGHIFSPGSDADDACVKSCVGLLEGRRERDEGVPDCGDYPARVWWAFFRIYRGH